MPSDHSAQSILGSGDPRGARIAGFSLVEMILVIAMIAVLGSIGISRFAGSGTHHGLDAAAARVVADLDLARGKAMALGASRKVTFNPNLGTYAIEGLPDINHPDRPYVVNLAAAPYQAVICDVDLDGSGGTSLTYDAFGVPVVPGGSPTAQLRVGIGGRSRTISVLIDARTGRAHVQP